MLDNNKDDLMKKINKELDKSIMEMDMDLVEKYLQEIQQQTIVDTKAMDRMSDKIIRDHKKSENEQKEPQHSFRKRVITTVAAMILIITCFVTVTAHKSAITDGLRWIGSKLHICSAPFESEMNKAAKLYFNSNEYALPSDLTDRFSARHISENKRKECTDTCIEMINSRYYINIIITTVYNEQDLKDIEAPSKNMEPKEQIIIDDIPILTFDIDGVYTAYYTFENKTYQLTSDMDYDYFMKILQTIKK